MRYTKMHGAGNSFIIVENLHGELTGADLSALARRLCSPKTGPGADGMIVLIPAPPRICTEPASDHSDEADFGMLFYNSDGSLGEMCGNGARCAARYGVEHGLSQDPLNIHFLATAGLITACRITSEQYEVRLNNPTVIDLHRQAEVDGAQLTCAYVELGNPGIPHAVVEVDADELEPAHAVFRAVSENSFGVQGKPPAIARDSFPDPASSLREKGRQLRRSPIFPKGANVTFFTRTGKSTLGGCQIKAITFERGVEDFTLACGTGCGATAVSLMLQGMLPSGSDNVEVVMPGGTLSVRVKLDGDSVRDVFLTGPTAVVEEGNVLL